MWRILKFTFAAPVKIIGAVLVLAGSMVGATGYYTIIPTSELYAKAGIVAATEADEREAAFSAFALAEREPVAAQTGMVFPQAKTFGEQMEKAGFSQRFSFAVANVAGAKEQPTTRLASLMPAVEPVKLPQEKPKIVKHTLWNPTLEQRKAIAHRYLNRVCPDVIKFDGQEPQADKMRVEASFMRATTPGQIISIVNREIRSSKFLRTLGYCPLIMAGT